MGKGGMGEWRKGKRREGAEGGKWGGKSEKRGLDLAICPGTPEFLLRHWSECARTQKRLIQ